MFDRPKIDVRFGAIFLAGACAAAALAKSPTLSDLETILKEKSPATVEAFVEALPPELRSNFTLVRKSESTQPASDSHPRVLSFSENGGLVIAYASKTGEPGSDKVEVMATDLESGAIVFREITFPGNGKKPIMSSDNPQRCASCHGRPPAPIWNAYNEWPGVYGSSDDYPKATKEEAKALADWHERRKDNPRTKPLVLKFDDPSAPYLDDDTPFKGRRADRMPNSQLTMALARNMALNVAERVRRSEFFARYGSAYLGYLSECLPSDDSTDPDEKRLFRDARAVNPMATASMKKEQLLAIVLGLGVNERFTPEQPEKEPSKLTWDDRWSYNMGVGGADQRRLVAGKLWETFAALDKKVAVTIPKPAIDRTYYDKALKNSGPVHDHLEIDRYLRADTEKHSHACGALRERIARDRDAAVTAPPPRPARSH